MGQIDFQNLNIVAEVPGNLAMTNTAIRIMRTLFDEVTPESSEHVTIVCICLKMYFLRYQGRYFVLRVARSTSITKKDQELDITARFEANITRLITSSNVAITQYYTSCLCTSECWCQGR